MTFDDGIVGVYELSEQNTPGKMPVDGLTLSEKFYFGYETLGINRYYTALQANQQVEAVISIPDWHEIVANKNIAIIADEDGVLDSGCKQYRIVMVQPTTDESNLRITRLTLERIGENYAVIS